MEELLKKKLLIQASNAALTAGKVILDIYKEVSLEITYKKDNSPITKADRLANEKIAELLAESSLPLLSEEGSDIDYSERNSWPYFWMIDPLDGTKEFIKKNGEFTVNIALIHGKKSIMGVIYVPVLNELYFGLAEFGAYKIIAPLNSYSSFGDLIRNSMQLPGEKAANFKVVASKSHLSTETQKFIKELKAQHQEIEIVSAGSSLKLCMIAEGKADVYPRFAPTMEWDTAAGQAIVEAAGKHVTLVDNATPVEYNKESLINPWFIAQ